MTIKTRKHYKNPCFKYGQAKQVVRLRTKGYTYEAISQKLNYIISRQRAFQIYKDYANRFKETHEE